MGGRWIDGNGIVVVPVNMSTVTPEHVGLKAALNVRLERQNPAQKRCGTAVCRYARCAQAAARAYVYRRRGSTPHQM